MISHDDTDHHIDRAGILPLPKRQIPIWLGGCSEPAWRRADRIGEVPQHFKRRGRREEEQIAVLRGRGSHVSVVTMGCGLTTIDEHVDAIRTWRELTS